MNKKIFGKYKMPEDVIAKARNEYVKYGDYSVIDHLNLGTVAWIVLFAWNTLIFGISMPGFDQKDYQKYNMSCEKAVKQRTRDLFYPISNGWYTSADNGLPFKYKYDESVKGEFRPRATWYVNIACLLVAAYWACSLSYKKLKQKRKNKAQEDMVDMILRLPFAGCHPRKVKRLMKIAPEIVSNMSYDRRIYFDALANPQEYVDMKYEIVNNDYMRAMAVEIMVGHLRSHPKDLAKVLAVCSENAIPRNMLMQKLKQYHR